MGILRNDTRELVNSIRISKDRLESKSEILKNIEPPDDWNEPFRKCLSYYLLKKERMERLIYPCCAVPIYKAISRQEAFTYHALKMLHCLSAEQLNKLLSFDEKGKDESQAAIAIIHSKIELYRMLFWKSADLNEAFDIMVVSAARAYPGYSFDEYLN
ncbi:hypothetical protein [Pseudomonas sp. LRF_L74]|uniref:hypothetical protein n=1 Tax=Pseudomonas sp. LRF_L74 TaxID=3369422 RepID=UPI003F631EFE